MLFSSMTFIFVFLPVLFIICLLSKKEYHNVILLIASIIFYAWGEPRFLLVMFLTILLNYLGAVYIEKYPEYKKLTLFLTITSTLGFLVYFKYFNFIIENINALFRCHLHTLDIILPLGISFYTFQAVSYVIDVYKGESQAQHSLYKLALFITFFPQLIAGPIIKYHDIADQIEKREMSFDKVCTGTKRFIVGLSKKMLLANTLGFVVDKIFIQDPSMFSHGMAWFSAIAYTMQLYFDFSAYSDMAIGLGLIFGFTIKENFNYPWSSRTMTEGWKRWHISLTSWFKKYVYNNIPIGGSRTKGMLKLAFVFLLTGIWHGANWTFILWGLYNALLLILEKLVNIKRFEKNHQQWWFKVLLHMYFIPMLALGLAVFRSENMHYALRYLANMLGILKVNPQNFVYNTSYYIGSMEIIVFIVSIILCTPLFSKMIYVKNKYGQILVNIWLLILFTVSVAAIASGTYNPFIYFRF